MESRPSDTVLPIACKLSSDELRARRGGLETLFGAVRQVRELPDGYEFAFPADATTARALLDFITEERECCSFFTFTLTFATPHDAIWLSLQGREGVKDFVRGGFGAITPSWPD